MLEFQQKYIEDAGELIVKLETELINFENDRENKEIIQEIFRAMHTLKGTSGMFGFNKIEEFTHLLEDIYDLIRSNKLTVNDEIIQLTFESVDILKTLLYSKEELDENEEQIYQEKLNIAKSYSQKEGLHKEDVVKKTHTKSGRENLLIRLKFKPFENILLRGIKPDSVIEELKALGENISFQFTDNNIDISNENSFNQYWEFFFPGKITRDSITDVFLFFDEDEYTVDELSVTEEALLDEFLLKSECIKKTITIEGLKKELGNILAIKEKKAPSFDEEKKEKTTKTVTIDDSIRVPAAKLDNLLNLVSDLILIHAQFENHSERLKDEKLLGTVKELSKLSRNFRDEILSSRLVQIAVLSTSMQRLVRDISKKLGKETDFITEGLQTELDKNIINKIEKPLMHIIRNCIDHGVEMPDERLKNHKPRHGVIRFIAFYSGASVFIQIQDDGKGIDPDFIFDKAVAKGFVKHNDVLTTQQIYDLIFLPGFSTAYEVTEFSGRGVGLDVVKKEITELHGEINVESEIGLGTSFTFKLPLTLSIVDALLVHCDTFKILIPTSNILICKYLPVDYFKNNDLQYQLENKCVPVKRLSGLFTPGAKTDGFEVLILITIYEKYFGLLVDRIITSMQAVIKPLGEMHNDQPYFIGASQLGDGSIAYILDTNFLLKDQ